MGFHYGLTAYRWGHYVYTDEVGEMSGFPAPVVVYWKDSRSNDATATWETFENMKGLSPAIVVTRGWMLDDTDPECIRVMRDWVEGEFSGSDYIAITREDILRIEHDKA